jgi:hypothetical protein
MKQEKNNLKVIFVILLAGVLLQVFVLNNFEWDNQKDVSYEELEYVRIADNVQNRIPSSTAATSSFEDYYTCQTDADCNDITVLYSDGQYTTNQAYETICCENEHQSIDFKDMNWCATQQECDKGLYIDQWRNQE